MSIQYAPLVKFHLLHDYFPDGNCPAVNVVPTDTTNVAMQRLNIRMVQREYGVELFYDTAQPVPSGTALSFHLQVTDHLFFLYTDLSRNQSTLLLSPADDPGAQYLNTVTYTTKTENLPDTHSITFTAKATIWRYWLIDQQNTFGHLELKDIASGNIVAATGESPKMHELPNGVEAKILSSPNPIPLRQQPGQVFELSTNQLGSDSLQTIPLPAASANNIKRERSDTGAFFSDIYVYL